MKRDYPDRPFVSVGAVIVDPAGPRAVLVRRATEPRRGEWSVPGGMVELGETIRQAARREALEETGLEVEPGEVLEVFDSILPDEQGNTRFHYVMIDVLCRPAGGELKAGGDVHEARWVSAAELDEFPTRPAIRELLRQAFARA
jgi:8-oxo-dGTP diphosphatase